MPSVSEKQHRAMEAAAHGHSTLGIPKSVGQEFVGADRKDAGKQKCAGILFIHDGKVLLLHRTDRHEWEGPGGHIEEGETAREAAIRECLEETGIDASDMDVPNTGIQTTSDEVDYQTFIVKGESPSVTLNHEHDLAEWFDLDALPASAHPGVAQALNGKNRADAEFNEAFETELDVAKAIRDGKLPSPQRIGSMWLFDLRVTGTGASYRDAHDEYVYRPPEHYLNDEFMERCQGLPVIFEHPEESMLDTNEFRQRSIGSIVLPYIPSRDDEKHLTSEVWGIARIYDGDAAELMQTSHVSTSPAVLLDAAGDSKSVKFDGSTLLIEGKPPYLDHLCVTPLGVWDKGGEPRGVS